MVLEVGGLTVTEAGHPRPVLEDVSFSVRAGEILGIGGLMGSGRTELLMHLVGGYGQRSAGRVRLAGEALAEISPAQAIGRGMYLVSEDRKHYGAVLGQSIRFNLSLSALRRLTRGGLIDGHAEVDACQGYFARLWVKAPDLETQAGSLSGSNQQKVVLGQGSDDPAAGGLPRRADPRHRRRGAARDLRADEPPDRRRHGGGDGVERAAGADGNERPAVDPEPGAHRRFFRGRRGLSGRGDGGGDGLPLMIRKSLSYRDLSLAGALLAITLFFPLHPRGGMFLTAQNLSNLSIEFAITATLALAMFLVLLPGMIDLSVGSGVGMIGGIACVLVTFHHWPAPAAMLAGFAVAAVVWAAMGTLIARQNVPAFIITTLGGLLVFQGGPLADHRELDRAGGSRWLG